MYGRKICLEYPVIKRQCNNCYGLHARKFCRSKRCGMESFVVGFSKRYANIPIEIYERLSYLVQRPQKETEINHLKSDKSKQTEQSKSQPLSMPQSQPQSQCLPQSKPQSQPQIGSNQVQTQIQERTKLKILLTKGSDGDWSQTDQNADQAAPPQRPSTMISVSDTVSSFLTGIRASFQQDNVIVTSKIQPKKNVTNNDKNAFK